MSIINQMLKDLEQRKNASDRTMAGLVGMQAVSERRTHKKNKDIFHFIIITLCSLSIIFFIYHKIKIVSSSFIPHKKEVHLIPFIPSHRVSAGSKISTLKQHKNIPKLMTDSSVETQYQRALNLSSMGAMDQSINMLNKLITEFPHFFPARELLINLLYQTGNPSRADQWVQNSLQLQSTYPPFVELAARALVKQNKTSEALQLLQTIHPSLKKNPNFYALMATLYDRQGQSDLATELYEQLVVLQPSNSVWWVGLGVALDHTGKQDQALIAYSRAEKTNNLSPELNAYVNTRLQG